MKTSVLVKRRDEAAELYHHPGVTQAKRPKVHSMAKDGTIDLKRVRSMYRHRLSLTRTLALQTDHVVASTSSCQRGSLRYSCLVIGGGCIRFNRQWPSRRSVWYH